MYYVRFCLGLPSADGVVALTPSKGFIMATGSGIQWQQFGLELKGATECSVPIPAAERKWKQTFARNAEAVIRYANLIVSLIRLLRSSFPRPAIKTHRDRYRHQAPHQVADPILS